jgi:hypothetical protein
MLRLLRKLFLGMIAVAILWGLLRNLIVAPGSGVGGLLVLGLVGYVVWRAWPAVRADLAALPRFGRLRLRGRYAGAKGDTL